MKHHRYVHIGGAEWCLTCDAIVTEKEGAAAVRDMERHEEESGK